jgi:CBS domain containing-hemolysin-like protein
MVNLVLIVILIIFLDSLISASEAAIYSVPLHRVKLLAEKNKVGKILLSLKESMERPIATLVALSNFVTVSGSIFVGVLAAKEMDDWRLGVFSAMLTFLIIIFGEIIPKRLGERFSTAVAMVAATPVQFISYLFWPITWVIKKITEPFLEKDQRTTSEEEIAFLATLAEEEGAIETGERKLIQRIFRFNDITAADIMTPKHMVTFVDGNKTVGEMAEFIQKTNHSRLPVFENEENNVIGIVHQRNLLLAITKGELGQPIKNYAWDAMIVPETRIIDDLLKDMRDKRAQLAVVVSEYGNIVGVVGIEDIIEELVGEIIDEKDIVPETIKRVSKTEILVHGQTRISYVNQFFNIDIKSKKTVNGFLLDKLGELPREGQTFEVKDIKFVVEMVGPRTIDRVRIIKKTENIQI